MAVAPQYASETADGSGDAVFMFPDVPQGQLWIGTVTIPTAPASAVGTVNVGGSPVGPLFGPGIYGPYIADYSRRLSLTITGLMPDTQYQAVWHADDEGEKYSTWPGTVTTTVEGTVVIPVPVEIQGTVTALQGDPPWAVDGTVTADQGTPGSAAWPVVEPLATAATGGSVSMTGGAVAVPSHAATRGVFLLAPSANAAPLTVNGATLDPGDSTGLLPVDNSDVFTATGTSGDVLSFLVT